MRKITALSVLEELNMHDILPRVTYRDESKRCYWGIRFEEAVKVIDQAGQSHVVGPTDTLLLVYSYEQNDWGGEVLVVSNTRVREDEYFARSIGAIQQYPPSHFPEIPSSNGISKSSIEPR